MKKVVTIIGARPQFVKAAMVSRAIAAIGSIHEILVHTGQHYDTNMSEVFFEQMGIPKPDYNLGVGGGNHGAMTGRQLEKIEDVLLAERPDYVLVYGDTNSTLAGALAAAKLHIPVGHVEAGLRSFNRRMPEEINRVVTDHIADLLLAPTEVSRENLVNEGIDDGKIKVVGDVMFDAALFYRNYATRPAWAESIGLIDHEYVLCTIHRAENTDDLNRLRSILLGLGNSGIQVVLPVHPRTLGRLNQEKIAIPGNILLVDPVGYLEMVWLEMHCRIIATDSGGVQKEAYFHDKPCVTMRGETEWVETIENGANVLVDADSSLIASSLISGKMPKTKSAVYGAGDSARRVAEALDLCA